MLTTQDISIVKSTVPLLEAGGVAVTEHFYNRMFEHNPELKDIFNMSNQRNNAQRIALFEAILAYAKHIEDPSVLMPVIERITQKHASFHILPAHYQIVGLHLIETMRELLPNEFTPEVEAAWGSAYQVLANLFIDLEENIYLSHEEKQGGWRGKRAFRVLEKRAESELVTSFVFEPVDGQAVMDYQPGQYLGIEVKDDSIANVEIRQYSLSDKPNGKTYRISVKREAGKTPGMVSNFLHDNLQAGSLVDLHAPCGDFFWQDKHAPVVLISAGVGVTPMQAMLETLASNNYGHTVHYLHACLNEMQHSFPERTETLCQAHNWPYLTWYQEASSPAQENKRHGLMSLSAVPLPIETGDFYLCGPVSFMKFAQDQLLELGVDADRIHYEVFGPHASL